MLPSVGPRGQTPHDVRARTPHAYSTTRRDGDDAALSIDAASTKPTASGSPALPAQPAQRANPSGRPPAPATGAAATPVSRSGGGRKSAAGAPPPEPISWSSAQQGIGAGVALPGSSLTVAARPSSKAGEHRGSGKPPKPAHTPEPTLGSNSPIQTERTVATPGSRAGRRPRMALHRARLDTPTVPLFHDDDEAAEGGASAQTVPHYSLTDVEGATDADRAGAMSKWPARHGTPALAPAHGRASARTGSPTDGSTLLVPTVDVRAPTSAFLADVSRYLAFELKHLPSNEGTEGRVRIAREAFSMIIDAFPSYATVLDTVKLHYDARIEALEAEVQHYAAAERLVQGERERYIAAQEQCKNDVAKERAIAERERRKYLAADHEGRERDQRLRDRIEALEAELQAARQTAREERAARREADDNTETYRRVYAELQAQWDAAKREVMEFRQEAEKAVKEIERDKRVAEASLVTTTRRFEMEKQELEAALEKVKAISLTPDQAAKLQGDLDKAHERIRRLHSKIDWMQRDLDKRSKYEPPVKWAEFNRPELVRLREAGVPSHQIVLRVLHDHERATAAEKALRERLAALSSVAEAVECGPLVASLPALAPTRGRGRHQEQQSTEDEAAADAEIAPLTAESDPWAPKSWLRCDLSPSGPLSTLPPSVHQHRAVRMWAAAALLSAAATHQPNLCLALEKACGQHVDFRTSGAFFNTVVFRLRTTFAGDPFLAFFTSLVVGRRNGIAHAHQLLLTTRAALQAFEALEKSLSGRVTGKLPKDALLAALPNAFPLKPASQLLALRQALFEQLDGTMAAGGFVGPDGAICVALPAATQVRDIPEPPEANAELNATGAASPPAKPASTADGSPAGSPGSPGRDSTSAGASPSVAGSPAAAGTASSAGHASKPTPLEGDGLVSFALPSATESAPGSPRAAGDGDEDGLGSMRVLQPAPWYAIAHVSYADIFGDPALATTGAASPFLVELCVQYERDVARGELALERRLRDAAVATGMGRFEGGVPEAGAHLVAWAKHKRFAAEVVLSATPAEVQQADVDDLDSFTPAASAAPDSPTSPDSPMNRSRSLRRQRTMSKSQSSRSFGGTALERAIRGLSFAIPSGGIVYPERMAGAVVGALGPSVAGPAAATATPHPTTGAMPSGLMRLLPDAAALGPEAASIPHRMPPPPTPKKGADAAAPTTMPTVSTAPLTVSAVFEAAMKALPLSGSFLVRCAAGSYVVPPSVFYSLEAAYTSGINLAASLHYDVPRKAVPPPPAPDAGGKASPKKRR